MKLGIPNSAFDENFFLRTSSAFSNGLLYCAVAAAVPVVTLILNARFSERDLIVTAIAMILYANIGFLLAFCNHRQDSIGIVSAEPERSAILTVRAFLFRIISAVLLAVYSGILIFFFDVLDITEAYGSVTEYLNFTAVNATASYRHLEIYTKTGAAGGAMAAAFIGAVLAPLSHGGRMVIRSAMKSSAFGFLVGTLLSSILGFIVLKCISEVAAYSVAVLAGPVGGVVVAITLRCYAKRRS